MKDWNAIAIANGLNLSQQELDRIVTPLSVLEEAFRPLVRSLPPELEPAFDFHTDGDGE